MHPRPQLTAAAVEAAQALEGLLSAIAASDGSRASVTQHLLTVRIRNGYAGKTEFDRAGDPLTAPVTIFRFRKGAQNTTGSAFFQDADVLTTIVPPPGAIPSP